VGGNVAGTVLWWCVGKKNFQTVSFLFKFNGLIKPLAGRNVDVVVEVTQLYRLTDTNTIKYGLVLIRGDRFATQLSLLPRLPLLSICLYGKENGREECI
jgi:hypothetical protein